MQGRFRLEETSKLTLTCFPDVEVDFDVFLRVFPPLEPFSAAVMFHLNLETLSA